MESVEGPTGTLLEVRSKECPQKEFRGIGRQREGVWHIAKTTANCVFPPG